MATEQLGERVSRLEGGYEHVATKADVAEVRAEVAQVETRLAEFRGEVDARFAEMDAKFAQFREEINSRFAKIDTRFAEMKANSARMENRITLRLSGLGIALAGALFAALRFLG